jgi:hypothetical protein
MAHLLVSAHQSAPAHPAFAASTGPPEAFLLPQDTQAANAHPATLPCRVLPTAALLDSDGAEPKHRSAAFTLPHYLGAHRLPYPFYSLKWPGIESPPLPATILPSAASPHPPRPYKRDPNPGHQLHNSFPLSSILLCTSKCHPTQLFAPPPSIIATGPAQSPCRPTPPGVRTPSSSSPSL